MKRKYIEAEGIKIRLDKRKNYKNIRIRVLPPKGQLAASCPEYISDRMIKAFIKKNIKSIRSTIKKQKELYKDRIQSYEDKSPVKIFGKTYRLKILESGEIGAYLDKDRIVLLLKDRENLCEAKKCLDKFLRKSLKEKAQVFIEKYKALMDLDINGFTIRKMKTKWGSCNVNKKHINLNFDLVRFDPSCLEYIVIHELAHLVHPGHGKDFYSFVETYCPQYKKIEEFLDKEIILY